MFLASLSCLADDRIRGRSVVEVLEQLRGPDLQFTYNSEVLTGSERVLPKPEAQDASGRAQEILAEHGLSLLAIKPGMYAIVHSPNSDPGAAWTDFRPFDRPACCGCPH